MDFQPLKYIYKASGNPVAYTLLLLHGTGGDETDMLPSAENFGNSYNILSLRGNVSENGMPRFFKRLGMGIFDEDDLHFRTDEMVAFVKTLASKEGFDPAKIIALGYSNGANIAGAALFKYPDFFAGAILYRAMQPFKKISAAGVAGRSKLFISSGSFDPTVDPADAAAYIEILKNLGFRVDFHQIATGHGLTSEDIYLSAQWLSENFGANQ